jgi:hypothetical protein
MCSNPPNHKVEGDSHGIKCGWFVFPFNYDPTWMRTECENFEEGKGGKIASYEDNVSAMLQYARQRKEKNNEDTWQK